MPRHKGLRSSVVEHQVPEDHRFESQSGTPFEEFLSSSVLFSSNYILLDISFSGLIFSQFLAVANFANIKSSEWFCSVGYLLFLIGVKDNLVIV